MKKISSQRILSSIVITYMMIALCWWSFLLFNKNEQTYRLESQLHPENITQIEAKYESQKKMILGEGCVFGLALIIGIYFINKAYQREVKTTERQNNFLLSITHELKSPLASIKLILQTLLKRKALPEDKVVAHNQNALSELGRLEGMVNNLLLTTKIDHAYQYNFEAIALNDVVEKHIRLFKHKYPDREISFEPGNVDQIEIDKEAFHSIIDNLLENAHKYSPKGGAIKVKTNNEQNKVVLQISDQGKGIPKEERAKIFNKFYRIGNEQTRNSMGSGLGLYIVHEIINKHGGSIQVSDNDGGGTVFSIYLPKHVNK